MRNFDYIKDLGLNDLYTFCSAAEEYQLSKPDFSALNSRKALEYIVYALYYLKNFDRPERATLFELIEGEPFREFVNDDRVMMAVHYVRKVGNRAAHTVSVTKKESFFALLNIYNVVGAILLKLKIVNEVHPFDKSLIPKTTEHSVLTPADVEVNANDTFVAAADKTALTAKEPVKELPNGLSEAETRRLYIDLLLAEAGWEVLTQENLPAAAKAGIEIRVEGMPNNKEEGYCDYVLYGKDGKPLAVVEAKRTSVDEKRGKHQAELYADCLENQYGVRPVIYYTNGFHTKIIDGLGYPPRPVMGFHTINDLELILSRRGRKKMTDLAIKDSITNRAYQKRAIRAVCDHLNEMHRRALIVMATGTGKTRVAISLCDVLLRNQWVKNVLFLADRTSLVKQAYDNFREHLNNYSFCKLTEPEDENNRRSARLMFSTYQTMINYIDAEDKEFSIGRFDLIILDEAHRSVFRKYTAIFEYFDSFLVGLTATPRDEVDRSTFDLFQLESNEPNFTYTQTEAENDEWLVGYNPISRTTRRMREGILYDSLTDDEKEQLDQAWEYEKARAEMKTGLPQTKTPRDIEKKELFDYIYNISTVDIVIQDLMNNGLKVNNGDKLGKTIIFAYDHKHAQLVVDRFYALYPRFGSDFCQLVDYSVNYAQDIIDKFKVREKMPQIAVSVDMLDTGIDVPDILNLVFFKPVYSKIKFIQMIGRGTRLSPGIFADGTDKKEFYIFDWCENFEYFNENSNGHEPQPTMSLSERLFGLMLDIAVILQHQKYQQDTFAQELCISLKDKLYEQVNQLNEKHISVRKHLDVVDRFKQRQKWLYLSELDALDMKQKIAPIILNEQDDNGSRMFDALMLHIELSKLSKEVNARRSKKKVSDIGQLLQRKASIPAVMEKMDIIIEVSNFAFWETASLERLEDVRLELRGIVYVTLGSQHETFYINISDTMEEKEGVEKPEFETDYHTRILDYLKEHRDSEAINKIYRLEQLTPADIVELERICWQELGTKEEYEDYVKKGQMICGDRVAAFIRSIIGIDRHIAKEKYSEFLSDIVLNSLQEEYLNQIIGYVCENGDITPETLLTDENFRGVDLHTVFGTNLVSIRRYVEKLHGVIA